jgi:hypothetical protein
MWDVAEVAYQAHNLMVEGSNPSPAIFGSVAQLDRATDF